MSPAKATRGDDPRDETPPHPSYDPSGAEPAGASDGKGTRMTDKVDVPIRTDAPREEQAPRRTANDREETDGAR